MRRLVSTGLFGRSNTCFLKVYFACYSRSSLNIVSRSQRGLVDCLVCLSSMFEMFMLPAMPSTSTQLLPCLELMFVMHVCTRMELDHVIHVGEVCDACIKCPPHTRVQIGTCTSRTPPLRCVCLHLKKATRSLLFANHSKHQHRNLIGAVFFRSTILPRKSHIRQEQPYTLGAAAK